MSKIAYISCYRDGTGYSKAAIEYMLALDAAGATVIPRAVRMTNTSGQVPNRILELEQNDLSNVDAVIQHNLPSQFSYKNGVINVGMFAYETNTLRFTGWHSNLKMMDKLVVFCEDQLIALDSVGLKNKAKIVPHAVDVVKFDKAIDKLDLGIPDSVVKFYAIGEFNKRKNWGGLLLAYNTAFSCDDNVALVIKTNNTNELKQLIENVRTGCGRFASNKMYPRIHVMAEKLTDDEMLALHASCDIYVSASHGESWNLPCSDALGFGNPCIVPDHGAFRDYVSRTHNSLIHGVMSPCFGASSNGLYQSSESWFSVNISTLAQCMKSYSKNTSWKEKKSIRSNDIKENYNHKVIGNRLLKAIGL